MRLNLHDIIDDPGQELFFDYEPDISDMSFDSISGFSRSPRAVGSVCNTAGVLQLRADVTAAADCICARCLKEFVLEISLPVSAVLAEEIFDEDNTDIYLLDGEYIDLDEVVITTLVLGMEQRYLCSEDCRGICPKCGKNLNEGPCSCGADSDPRLAVLGQLLEKQ